MIGGIDFVDAPGSAVPGIPYGMMALPNEGVKTVVFVKGIPSEADNNLMSSILSRCGKVRPSHLSPSVTACSAFRELLSLKRGEDTSTGVLKVGRMQVFLSLLHHLTVPLQDFAFAEYENADSALRALRLLHNMDMGTGKLSLKCDTKTQAALQEHHRVKIQKVFDPSFCTFATLQPLPHSSAGDRCHFLGSCPQWRFPPP